MPWCFCILSATWHSTCQTKSIQSCCWVGWHLLAEGSLGAKRPGPPSCPNTGQCSDCVLPVCWYDRACDCPVKCGALAKGCACTVVISLVKYIRLLSTQPALLSVCMHRGWSSLLGGRKAPTTQNAGRGETHAACQSFASSDLMSLRNFAMRPALLALSLVASSTHC